MRPFFICFLIRLQVSPTKNRRHTPCAKTLPNSALVSPLASLSTWFITYFSQYVNGNPIFFNLYSYFRGRNCLFFILWQRKLLWKISFSYRYDKLCDFLVRVNTTLSMQIQLSITGVVFPQTAITLERNSSILPETLVERIEGAVYQNSFPPA